jgi:peroxiredoxin Q/BCP
MKEGNKMELAIGKKAPDFMLPNQLDETKSLDDFAGQWLVLYFYPKDNTPGCTTEAIEFTAAKADFAALNCQIVGVSPDSTKKHRSFCKKHSLDITLLADENTTMLQEYGVWQTKSLYGKSYLGVVRTTVLIDTVGTIRQVWNKVKVKDHVTTVLQELENLQK